MTYFQESNPSGLLRLKPLISIEKSQSVPDISRRVNRQQLKFFLELVRVNIITLLMGAPLVELQVIDSFYLLHLYLWSSMLAIRCLEDIPTIVEELPFEVSGPRARR